MNVSKHFKVYEAERLMSLMELSIDDIYYHDLVILFSSNIMYEKDACFKYLFYLECRVSLCVSKIIH